MRTLARTARTPDEIREPYPVVFKTLDNFGIAPKRGSVTMFVAPPASGKSYIVLKWAQLLAQAGIRTLYFTADTSMQDQLERAAAMATGNRIEQIREDLLSGGEDYYGDILAESFENIRWVAESDPTYEDIELEVSAYAEAYGSFPELIVIDNLVNVVGEAESEFASEKETTRVLHRLVRVTGAGVWVLHHMNERKTDPSYPAPRVDIANKLSQLPELIISLAAGDGVMRFAKVKDRSGSQDPSGGTFTTLHTDLDRGRFYETAWHREQDVAI